MRYQELLQFISKRMRMSHIYQPRMLITLLKHGGQCSAKTIAKAILSRDESQLEYYENITNNMVGRVLRKHGIVERERDNYKLVGFETLTKKQAAELIVLCQDKLNEYLEKRGEQVWLHRKQSAGYISGTLRYEVLKRAKFHCELCGISAELKALEVDHITPRNKGVSRDLSPRTEIGRQMEPIPAPEIHCADA